jgi:hypothetical protein
MHATPKVSFGVPQNQRSQSTRPVHLKSALRIEKKAKIINFRPILCMPSPSINRSQRESKYESIVQEAVRKFEMSGDKRKKRNPPNYKFLGGEAEETGDP